MNIILTKCISFWLLNNTLPKSYLTRPITLHSPPTDLFLKILSRIYLAKYAYKIHNTDVSHGLNSQTGCIPSSLSYLHLRFLWWRHAAVYNQSHAVQVTQYHPGGRLVSTFQLILTQLGFARARQIQHSLKVLVK